MFRRIACFLAVAACLQPAAAQPAEPVDWEMVNRIRAEGFHRSQALDTLTHLTEIIGPRLTGSPQMKEANEWTRDQLAAWGLANAHLEPFEFGRGWSFDRAAVHMVAPHRLPLVALPEAWTPGTDGPVRAPLVKVKLTSEKDLEKQKGKLAGKILLLARDERPDRPDRRPASPRYSEEDLAEIREFEIPGNGGPPPWRERFLKRWKLRRAMADFLVEEGVVATLKPSSWEGGLVRVGAGGSWEPDENPGVTSLVLAAEHYNRLERLLEREQDVELEIDVAARFHDDDLMAYNTVAEIPGTDKASEIVLVGAHLDSWHGGTGATDNGAGSVMAMEAVRILKALGVTPRRTIRIALWSGEEQGLKGSRAYVAEHLASRPEPEDPEEKKLPSFLRENGGPLTLEPAHETFSAYFNLDNGGGKIRGIWGQENAAVRPIFEAWLAPFNDLGADTFTLRNTRGTDHLSFDDVGLPGFQFIQDQLDYFRRTHHTNLDTLDYIEEEDLKQASVVMASFLYHAAMRDGLLPRKPMPEEDHPEETVTEEDLEIEEDLEVEGEAEGEAAPPAGRTRP